MVAPPSVAKQFGQPDKSDCQLFEARLTHLINASTLGLSVRDGNAEPESQFDPIDHPDVARSLDLSEDEINKLTVV